MKKKDKQPFSRTAFGQAFPPYIDSYRHEDECSFDDFRHMMITTALELGSAGIGEQVKRKREPLRGPAGHLIEALGYWNDGRYVGFFANEDYESFEIVQQDWPDEMDAT